MTSSACLRAAVAVVACATATTGATADLLLFSDASGLSGEAEFTITGLNEMQIRLRNTSTGLPDGFGSADQILTSIAWDFGGGGQSIIGGSVLTGANSASVNFSIANVGANADVSGEYGFGNGGATGLLDNFVSGNTAGATPFGGANLDGPVSLNGPQGGLVSMNDLLDLGGLGAIRDEIVITVQTSQVLADLSFLDAGATIEFGSDAAFLTTVPAPGSIALLLGLGVARRRRRG